MLVLFTFVCRTLVYLSLKSSNPLVITLGDPNYVVKDARLALNLIYLSWNSMSFLISMYIKYTQRCARRQKWTLGMIEFFASNEYRGEETSTKALKYFYTYTTIQRAIAIINAFFACVPFFFNSPLRHWPSGVFATLHYTAVAYATGSLLCNVAPLFAFTFYMYGKYYESLTRKVRGEGLSRLQSVSYIKELVFVYKQMLQTYEFFQPMNNIAFVGTFLARILILYYIFFTDLNFAFRVFFFMFLPLSDQSGQQLHFFSSAFSLNKVP